MTGGVKELVDDLGEIAVLREMAENCHRQARKHPGLSGCAKMWREMADIIEEAANAFYEALP